MERAAVSVVCGQPLFAGNRKGSLLNPSRIVEGLSPSTENYNRSRKFENHRSIESLGGCILVTRDRMPIADSRIRTLCDRGNSWNPHSRAFEADANYNALANISSPATARKSARAGPCF